MSGLQQLADSILKGKPRSIAKTITLIENNMPEAREIMSLLYPHTGKAHVIGVTGPSGVGKSTLVEKLTRRLRRQGKSVGVVAVDPTSPFSGGAFLGDRIRMQDLTTDKGVFIRSMATRNNPGGVAKTTKDAVRVLDASGKDVVLVETAGAGQSEVDIIKIADTIIVVLAPGLGDEIQAIKAGIMEIADIFVVNKADRENANKTVSDIQAILELGGNGDEWKPVIVQTTATAGEGTELLLENINEHKRFLEKHEIKSKHREIAETEFLEAIKQNVATQIFDTLKESGQLDLLVSQIIAKKTDPMTAAEKVTRNLIEHQSNIRRKPAKREPLKIGLVQVYTGEGKGKTTAAFGLAIRALGKGLKVYMIQFIKGGFDYGELQAMKQFANFELKAYGRGKFITEKPPHKEDIRLAKEALNQARKVIASKEYDIVILDEVNVAMTLKLIEVKEVINLIEKKPRNVELVLTGRSAPPEIIEIADLVTEMKEIRHPFQKGIAPRQGIEY